MNNPAGWAGGKNFSHLCIFFIYFFQWPESQSWISRCKATSRKMQEPLSKKYHGSVRSATLRQVWWVIVNDSQWSARISAEIANNCEVTYDWIPLFGNIVTSHSSACTCSLRSTTSTQHKCMRNYLLGVKHTLPTTFVFWYTFQHLFNEFMFRLRPTDGWHRGWVVM